MDVKDLSIGFHTNKIAECKAFYKKYFSAEILFDCGWYATIKFEGNGKPQVLSFMQPQEASAALFTGGISIYLQLAGISELDAEYERLAEAGLTIAMPPEDHKWGDRGFTVEDPIGTTLYIYTDIPISEKYADAVKK